jgi:hypothetical protein
LPTFANSPRCSGAAQPQRRKGGWPCRRVPCRVRRRVSGCRVTQSCARDAGVACAFLPCACVDACADGAAASGLRPETARRCERRHVGRYAMPRGVAPRTQAGAQARGHAHARIHSNRTHAHRTYTAAVDCLTVGGGRGVGTDYFGRKTLALAVVLEHASACPQLCVASTDSVLVLCSCPPPRALWVRASAGASAPRH